MLREIWASIAVFVFVIVFCKFGQAAKEEFHSYVPVNIQSAIVKRSPTNLNVLAYLVDLEQKKLLNIEFDRLKRARSNPYRRQKPWGRQMNARGPGPNWDHAGRLNCNPAPEDILRLVKALETRSEGGMLTLKFCGRLKNSDTIIESLLFLG